MTTTTPMGTRHARAAATRERILSAAHELFVANGYRSTSLRDIAAAASVSHPGLLGHFSSKDDLLAEVVAELESENEAVFSAIAAASEPGDLVFAALAERNARTEGYLELFAALTGEASAPGHPAHERMRERYCRLRSLSSDVLEDAKYHGVIAADRDVDGETVRHTAGWDGLQLLSQYLPDRVDVVAMLEERESLWASPLGWRDPEDDQAAGSAGAAGPLPELPIAAAPEIDPGYAVGRRRRTQIVADAMHLFARDGYGDTSLQDIATAVGVSKSTLLHHYSSKELLLSAVLAERDSAINENQAITGAASAGELLRGIPDGAALNGREEPGLIEVYAVLSCEAVPAAHPAHAYFENRFANTIDYFTALFRLAQIDGDLPAHRDPAHEAVWLVAMWDGLQYQWLYDRDAVDIAAHLRAHLDDVLPRDDREPTLRRPR
ncbi:MULTISPECIES: TetR/AcrR family transcriptional regulator [unclassified Microbacterium]|uniref:TetR/AcrR family transcriptional regulator n=1 Tax=unclassified Microbacterium TaxID=2609290 RepID=UPI001604FD00|nr:MULTISPECIES: TetR/AcrR family transcriptional regulator [unclassified Microbacterium]QNA91674.1 TetR/AcrR family transcriptional regulator [Microbacterium sp. Se63.02b]QYM64860.1 TetR/AcrR family transcriptional regulator [Microbacterium sp. Se5.02b]